MDPSGLGSSISSSSYSISVASTSDYDPAGVLSSSSASNPAEPSFISNHALSNGGAPSGADGGTTGAGDGMHKADVPTKPTNTSTNANKPYKCAECGQAYARSEHLDRHARTHLPNSKYPCDKCSKQFARSDVLKRHKKLHERDTKAIINAAGAGSLSARKKAAFDRSAKACVSCATSKVKCTGEQTCQRCVTLNRQCIYDNSEGRRSSVKRARKSSSAGVDRATTSPSAAGDDDGHDDEEEDELDGEETLNGHSRFEDLLAITGSANLDQIPTEYSSEMNLDQATGQELPQPMGMTPSAASGIYSAMTGGQAYSGGQIPSNYGASTSSALVPSSYTNNSMDIASFNQPPFNAQSAPTRNSGFASQQLPNFGLPASLLADFTASALIPNGSMNANSNEFFENIFQLSPGTQNGLNTNTLELASDNSFFWNSFLSPPAMVPDPAPASTPAPSGSVPQGQETTIHASKRYDYNAMMDTKMDIETPSDIRGSDVGSNHSSAKARIIISANGVATRHHSPEPGHNPASAKSWLVWNPTEDDNQLKGIDAPMGDISSASSPLAIDDLAHIPPMDETVRLSMLETLRFCEISDREYHALYRTLSRIPLPTYDLILKLFLHRWHRHLPFIHLPSFNPRKTVGFLLNSMIGIGLAYLPVPGALQLGRVLLELCRRGMGHLTDRDNRMARSLPMVQTVVLWSTCKWSGSPRSLELAEVFRGVYNTCLRRLCVFEEPFGAPYPGETVEQRWEAFIQQEERRRTGMVCFLLDAELTTLVQTGASIDVSELKTCLPCSEQLWEAKTAVEWEELQLKSPPPLSIPSLYRLIAADGPFPLAPSIKFTPFSAHILVKSLHLQLYHALQFASMGMTSIAVSASTHVRRSLARLGRGVNEFTPTFGIDMEQNRYLAATLGYHLAHLATYVRLDLLEMVAARETAVTNGTQRKHELISWMSAHVEEARTVALHAGQIFRMVRQHSTYGPPEFGLFYASLALYLFSLSNASKFTPSPASGNHGKQVYRLDVLQSAEHDPSTWIAAGGPCAIEGIHDLSVPEAPKAVLSKLGDQLYKAGSVWKYGQVLAMVLKELAEREVVGASTTR